ncbi:unnamed protein product [Calicophoron daubneyi]|uniref:Uncharacterized protein n=1 Tax=Calicophoron daubneyi TaxID=300641 RepID=A0AAV2TTX3_CALDB
MMHFNCATTYVASGTNVPMLKMAATTARSRPNSGAETKTPTGATVNVGGSPLSFLWSPQSQTIPDIQAVDTNFGPAIDEEPNNLAAISSTLDWTHKVGLENSATPYRITSLNGGCLFVHSAPHSERLSNGSEVTERPTSISNLCSTPILSEFSPARFSQASDIQLLVTSSPFTQTTYPSSLMPQLPPEDGAGRIAISPHQILGSRLFGCCSPSSSGTDPVDVSPKVPAVGLKQNHILASLSDNPVESRAVGQLQLTFLPAESRSDDENGKLGRSAEVIGLKDGSLKLFVERGRVIETCITYVKPTSSHTEQTEEEMISHLRLNFIPYTNFGGIYKPAIGYHDHMQKVMYQPSEQVCFVQAAGDQENEVEYKIIKGGFHIMESKLRSYRSIYHLVFPFLNSKCPSTWRKDVYVRVSVQQEDGLELAATTFQAVSCASPVRDAKRFRSRQTESNSANMVRTSTPRSAMVVEVTSRETRPCIENTVKPNFSGDLDISPGSSGFVSHCSSLTFGAPDEDSLPELSVQYPQPSGFSNTETLNSVLTATSPHPVWMLNHTEGCSSPSGMAREILDLELSNSSFSQSDRSFVTAGLQAGSSDVSTQSEIFYPVPYGSARKRSASRTDTSDSCEPGETEGGEYVIKTKNRRIYQILSIINKGLSGEVGLI